MKKLKLFLIAFFTLLSASCYISFGNVDEIEIPEWLIGTWAVTPGGSSISTDIISITVSSNEIIIETPSRSYNLLDDLTLNGGRDELIGDRYYLYYTSINEDSFYFKDNGDQVYYYPSSYNLNYFYIMTDSGN